MIIAGIIIGTVVALLGGLGVLTRTVYTLSGKIENGLTDKVDSLEDRLDWLVDVTFQQARSDPTVTVRPPPEKNGP